MNVENILKELDSSYYDIPFGNSDYQNKTFVMAAEMTPGRAYRHIGLRMFDRIAAIKELKYNRKLEDIDIEEKQHEADDVNTTSFNKRRRLIEIEQILDKRVQVDKLLNDAIQELNCLYSEFIKFPKYTRLDFEREEESHFALKIQHKENSLLAMGLVKEFDNLLLESEKHIQLNQIKE
jgi:hypothetical protein